MIIESKYAGLCSACRTPHEVGQKVEWKKGRKGVRCLDCAKKPPPVTAPGPKPPRDNQSLRVDYIAREIPGRAHIVAALIEQGDLEQAQANAVQLAIDLNLALKDGDYELRLRIPDDGGGD